MMFDPVHYDAPLFRPPAEAYSVILQATLGCSWNRCAFCEMYTSKKFRVREPGTVMEEIRILAEQYPVARKVFVADGNAMVLSSQRLSALLEEIRHCFPKLQRVAAYALPKEILAKSNEELKTLRNLGLKLLYIGIETGNDELLKMVNKGETAQSTADGILKAHDAGIDTSVMIINGLGGEAYSRQHALDSAALISKVNPKFLSTLTLSLPFGVDHYRQRFNGTYTHQSLKSLFSELYLFIENIAVEGVIFRSNHVSNNLPLEGTLSKDKQKLLEFLRHAIKDTSPDRYPTTSGIL
jgi:radical SAM superfamily enzyme YgiQ (UPF0313 family)